VNVNADGSLSLFVCDLNPEHREVPEASLEDFHFSSEARIAAAYANRAGYRVTFVRAGSKAPRRGTLSARRIGEIDHDYRSAQTVRRALQDARAL